MEVLLKPKSTLRISGITGHFYKAWTGPKGSRRLRLPEFLDNQYMKEASLSALHTSTLYPQETSLVLISEGKNTTGLCNNVPPVQCDDTAKLQAWQNAVRITSEPHATSS
jgi:hypothetical protein